jgi:hypothetical protein
LGFAVGSISIAADILVGVAFTKVGSKIDKSVKNKNELIVKSSDKLSTITGSIIDKIINIAGDDMKDLDSNSRDILAKASAKLVVSAIGNHRGKNFEYLEGLLTQKEDLTKEEANKLVDFAIEYIGKPEARKFKDGMSDTLKFSTNKEDVKLKDFLQDFSGKVKKQESGKDKQNSDWRIAVSTDKSQENSNAR